MKILSLTEEARKNQSLPSISRIKQVQSSWKGRIDILKSFKERCTLMEDKKSPIFFKLSDSTAELGGPPLIQDSTLIFPYEMEVELSKLKDKCVGEFYNMPDFFEDNMRTWIVDYVNLNNTIFFIVGEAHAYLIEVEKEIFEMKIK